MGFYLNKVFKIETIIFVKTKMYKGLILLVLTLFLLKHGMAEETYSTEDYAHLAWPVQPEYMKFRGFLLVYGCGIPASTDGSGSGMFPHRMYTPSDALAQWDMIKVTCRHLLEDFYAAKCRS